MALAHSADNWPPDRPESPGERLLEGSATLDELVNEGLVDDAARGFSWPSLPRNDGPGPLVSSRPRRIRDVETIWRLGRKAHSRRRIRRYTPSSPRVLLIILLCVSVAFTVAIYNTSPESPLYALEGIGLILSIVLSFLPLRKEIRTGREVKITQALTWAVAQLRQSDLEVRLSGIDALERIANDSPRDQDFIAEVLAAYVRANAPIEKKAAELESKVELAEIPPLRTRAGDIQAILTLLGRRKTVSGVPQVLDLSDTDLRRADLRNANLHGVDLRRANLQGSDLGDANLQRADLQHADLRLAFLTGALLKEAIIREALLDNASLFGAYAEGADFEGAHLQMATLGKAHLGKANLRNVNLEWANLSSAFLQEASLEGANLRGARLAKASLAEASLEHSTADQSTEWPDNFDYKGRGVIIVDET